MNNDIKVEGSGETKMKGKKKGWRKCKYLKIKWMLKKNYSKIGKKKNNDVDADVA